MRATASSIRTTVEACTADGRIIPVASASMLVANESSIRVLKERPSRAGPSSQEGSFLFLRDSTIICPPIKHRRIKATQWSTELIKLSPALPISQPIVGIRA